MLAKTKHGWTDILSRFSERNNNRPTRLGVFVDEMGTMQDYWIEDGLPLMGIAVDSRDGRTDVDLMLGEKKSSGDAHLTHSIRDAEKVTIVLGLDPSNDSLEIRSREGKSTVLRFENF